MTANTTLDSSNNTILKKFSKAQTTQDALKMHTHAVIRIEHPDVVGTLWKLERIEREMEGVLHKKYGLENCGPKHKNSFTGKLVCTYRTRCWWKTPLTREAMKTMQDEINAEYGSILYEIECFYEEDYEVDTDEEDWVLD